MILGIYFGSVLASLGLNIIHNFMIKNGYMQADPLEAMEELQEILKSHPELEPMVDCAFDNPQLFILLMCICPFINILFCIACIKNIFSKQ